MNRSVTLFLRTWALGFTAWTIVYTREVPTALAQSVIETDCSADLDQPDTIYILSTSTIGDCIIAADNIILDGQGLYEINGNVRNDSALSFSVHNVPLVDGYVTSYYGSNDYGGDVSIHNSTIDGNARAFANGKLKIINSTIGGYGIGDSGVSISNATINGTSGYMILGSYDGDIEIKDSTVNGTVHLGYAYDQIHSTHAITVEDSTIGGYVAADFRSLTHISITNSITEGDVLGSGDVVITDSTIEGAVNSNRGSVVRDMVITNSVVQGGVSSQKGTVSVTDSVTGRVYLGEYDASNAVTVTDSEVNGGMEVYSSGDVFVTDSTIHGEIEMYTGYASVTRSLIEGDIGRAGTLLVEDSTITGDVNAVVALTITDNAPSLTVTPLTLSLDYGEDFNPFEDVTASDIKDGDLSDDVVVIGTVGEEEGVYELQYLVTDSGTTLFNIANGGSTSTVEPNTTSVTRTVTRGNKPTQSTSIGVHKERKEKVAAEAAALPGDTIALIDTLRTTLAAPGSTNDPEALKDMIDLVRQLIVALLELLAAEGKVK